VNFATLDQTSASRCDGPNAQTVRDHTNLDRSRDGPAARSWGVSAVPITYAPPARDASELVFEQSPVHQLSPAGCRDASVHQSLDSDRKIFHQCCVEKEANAPDEFCILRMRAHFPTCRCPAGHESRKSFYGLANPLASS
jgi:hypothetical protein